MLFCDLTSKSKKKIQAYKRNDSFYSYDLTILSFVNMIVIDTLIMIVTMVIAILSIFLIYISIHVISQIIYITNNEKNKFRLSAKRTSH